MFQLPGAAVWLSPSSRAAPLAGSVPGLPARPVPARGLLGTPAQWFLEKREQGLLTRLPSSAAPKPCLAQSQLAAWHRGETLLLPLSNHPLSSQRRELCLLGLFPHKDYNDSRDTCSLIVFSPETPSGFVSLWLLTTACCQRGLRCGQLFPSS